MACTIRHAGHAVFALVCFACTVPAILRLDTLAVHAHFCTGTAAVRGACIAVFPLVRVAHAVGTCCTQHALKILAYLSVGACSTVPTASVAAACLCLAVRCAAQSQVTGLAGLAPAILRTGIAVFTGPNITVFITATGYSLAFAILAKRTRPAIL